MKAFKKVCTLVLTFGMTIASFLPVHAVEVNPAAETATQGVVQVNTVIVGDNAKKYVVTGGSGFIIGDSEGTEYVITSSDVVNPDDELLKEACDYYGLINKEDKGTINLTLSTEVVIESDVVLNASVLTVSSELDMVVLQLPQPIYTRTPLKILTNNKYDTNNLPYSVGDTVFALGYPEAITYESERQYLSDQQIQMSAGEIKSLGNVEGVQVISSDVTSDTNNYGGPLVDANGYVIGMNLPIKDGAASCALDSTKIAKILDGLGVSYSQVNSSPKAQVEEEDTEEVTEQDQGDELVLTPPVKENKGVSETVIIIICLIGVFVLACGATALVILLLNRGKSGKSKKANVAFETEAAPQPVDSVPTVNQAIANNRPNNNFTVPSQQMGPGAETTILSAVPSSNDGETSILSDEPEAPQNLGTLVRKKTDENISISKTNFVIGKDAVHADFCVSNNSSISRKHAMITSGRNGAYIQDCNSTNGTYINGTKIESERPVLLNNGDIVRLSNEEFEYKAI
ncbi:FHA domain-containing protein [Pseudobutyrivibrio xylanivorans]|uniref:FHA domain-containing protein n=1 Tax=Pseudobutyrivibrio xylanivorans TaxID=185007 RepID=A0A5P6VM49_PSEXY|nr:FHA domain-containing protein [Pseudobutyrivibrio xylanivorans]QFJ53736.1 FHA domain-containing protein [Pseudobutyrivibrio xylanivorans]